MRRDRRRRWWMEEVGDDEKEEGGARRKNTIINHTAINSLDPCSLNTEPNYTGSMLT